MTTELDRFEELLNEFLEGHLEAADADELSQLLEGDSERRKIFVEHYRQNRVLVSELRPVDQAFARRVIEALEADRPPFVAGVMTEIRRRWQQRRWALVAISAAGLALVGAGVFGLRPGARDFARVVAAGPQVVVRHGGSETPGRPGVRLERGDTIVTGAGSTATIRFAGEPTLVQVGAFTELTVASSARGKQVELRHGEIEVTVAREPTGKSVVLSTSQAEAEVVGTRLGLYAKPAFARIEVFEGLARWTRTRDGASVEVPAAHFSEAGSGLLRVMALGPQSEGLPSVVGFALVSADDPLDVLPGYEDLSNEAVIDLSRLPAKGFNLLARTDPKIVGSVRFALDGQHQRGTETMAPYTLVSHERCLSGDSWRPAPGRHAVTATPFSSHSGNRKPGLPGTIALTFIRSR